MRKKVLRILGLEGRTTIPFELREQMGFSCGDVISFTRQDDDTILLKRELLCDNCTNAKAPAPQASANRQSDLPLMSLLDSLTPAQQQAALVHLSVRWAELHDRDSSLGVGT